MDDLERYLQEQLEDPEFRKAYDDSLDEFLVAKALIDARLSSNLTQKELSERSGVRQSNISRIERFSCSPTVSTLSALAKGMGKRLVVRFEEK